MTTSSRPWRRNPEWPGDGHGHQPGPILDANGVEVVTTSEWIDITEPDVDLIVRAVNAFTGPTE